MPGKQCTGGKIMRLAVKRVFDRLQYSQFRIAIFLGVFALSLCGCTGPLEYCRNGFKVGPNYQRPPAAVAEQWIDADDVRVRSDPTDAANWWASFNDPVLDDLVQTAYRQNLSLREAGFRVLAQRAELGIAVGKLFPQDQYTSGQFAWNQLSSQVANRFGTPQFNYGQWEYGFAMAWELDFWGRYRRAVEASRGELESSVENYDDVLVSLIGDVASNYVLIRTLEQQIVYLKENVRLQETTLKLAQARFKGGQASELDVNQAQSDLSNTESDIPELEISVRQANDRLCVLLGIPPEDLKKKLGEAPIPAAAPEVAVGIPADLLRRRPDVRRAERNMAAQCAQIGVATSLLYPQITINGTFGWSSEVFKDLFGSDAFRGSAGPSFRWDVLNYCRLLNNIRLQDAKFQELAATYQNTVLQANSEVEDGLIRFLKAQQRSRLLNESVNAELKAVNDAIAQYKGGLVDFNRVALIQEKLVERQNLLAQAQGEIALGLVEVYRALGGGWQIRCQPEMPAGPWLGNVPVSVKKENESLPLPAAVPENVKPE